MLKLFNLLTIILCFSSCSIITFENLEISSNIPENAVYFNQEKAELNFSIPVLFNDITDILILKKGSYSIKYDGIFQDTHFSFLPEEGWQKNQSYSIIINTELKTKKGNFKVKFQRDYIYGIENDFFILENFELPDFVTDNSIKLKFNKSINLNSLETTLSIQPYINLSKQVDDDNKTITLTPTSNWPVNTWFTLSIRELKSKDGYTLQNPVMEHFIPKKDMIIPQLECAYFNDSPLTSNEINNYTPCKTILSFKFNKTINITDFKNYFSISPSHSGEFTQNENTITFTPSTPFTPATEYTITIPQKINDINNINLLSDYVYKFTTKSEFLNITDITINQTENIPYYSDSLAIPYPIIISSNINRLFIKITFDSELKVQQKNSLDKYFSIAPYFPSDIKFPKLISLKQTSDCKSIILEYENFTTSTQTPALYKFQITGDKSGILNKQNLYMEKNACVIFSLN